MKYTPCADSAFRGIRYYCGYNAQCFTIFKTQARLKEVYDKRNGVTCSVSANQCPC